METQPRIQVAGENALIIYFGSVATAAVSAHVQHTAQLLRELMGPHLIDLIPSYASLLVLFDPLSCDPPQVCHWIEQALEDETSFSDSDGQLVELPVWYSAESGPDLEELAARAGLSVDDVIRLHQATDYRVYAIGFAPGFAYLGEVDERLATPRLATPRRRVPQGAVAIADRQTAVYPTASPGGWNLIGLCPTPMFDPHASPSMPVSVGDRVRFTAIDRQQFLELGGQLPGEIR
ncbi:5-oxoprolinase subunit PxpB [Pseudomaricurvus sp. HS19]|uniref:5-oxoprolinase subunit PxpB n=1 Tax=Pseudomaricurvus sp. HS19 TaxID=2692626 RepID=UPI00136A5BFE|nr:5-oxoprolinase subunit PxpB [Pseudomaricurvus sp. HS19]MYM64144.1 5-oxoprolinase subunit PxpB [Pseudomaricurvus sp. HS19]